MSLPKPDLHVRLDADPMYWLRTIADIEGRPMSEIACDLLSAELLRRGDQMTRLAQRLVKDRRVIADEAPISAERSAANN